MVFIIETEPVRSILVVLFANALLQAQFNYLVAPGSGTTLYFSTDDVLKGSDDWPQGRIFQIGDDPLAVLFSVDFQAPPSPPPGRPSSSPAFSNYYDLRLPDASRDASVMSHVAKRDCRNPASAPACIYTTDYYQTVLNGIKAQLTIVGESRLSGNGRYLLTAIPGTLQDGSITVSDLEVGAQTSYGVARGTYGVTFDVAGRGRLVADDGTTLFIAASGDSNSGLYVLHDGKADRIGAAYPPAQEAAIDALATTILYTVTSQSDSGGRKVIRIHRLDRGQDDLFVDASGGCYQPQLTADGLIAAFICPAFPGDADPPGLGQVYTMSLDGTSLRATTADPDGVVTYAMSDDGSRVWYVSELGSLKEVDLSTGQSTERIPPTPKLFDIPQSFRLVAGIQVTLAGVGFTEDTKVTVSGIAAPILSITTVPSDASVYPYRTKHDEITFEVPAGIDIQDGKASVTIENGSPLAEHASLPASY